MQNPFQSLRVRLVLFNLAMFGTVIVLLVGVFLFVAERFLRSEFDQRLIEGARVIAEAVDLVAEEVPASPRESRFRPHINPFHFLEYYFQIRLTNGQLIERSPNLRHMELPISEHAKQSGMKGALVFETLNGETATQLIGAGHQLRMLTFYHQRPGMQPFYLQVAVSLTSVEHAVEVLRRTMLVLIPIGLILAAIASEQLVRRGLAPIGRVAREAQRLTAADLDHRLPVPSGRDEVVEMIRTLNNMLDRLQGAFAAQERFIANAAHELKTPLTHLLGQAQVLSRQVREPEEYDLFVTTVQEEMRQLATIVESLLLLTRADAGLPLDSRTRVSINEVVVDAVERCQPYAEQREVRLQPVLCAPTAEQDEPEVEGDAELLVSMVSNLVRNAIRFSPPGQTVDVAIKQVASEVLISVCDRGPGIPDEFIPRLFERFYQVPGVGRPVGSGLGLSIVESVAKLHHGLIRVRNRAEGGCEFEVTLPHA